MQATHGIIEIRTSSGTTICAPLATDTVLGRSPDYTTYCINASQIPSLWIQIRWFGNLRKPCWGWRKVTDNEYTVGPQRRGALENGWRLFSINQTIIHSSYPSQSKESRKPAPNKPAPEPTRIVVSITLIDDSPPSTLIYNLSAKQFLSDEQSASLIAKWPVDQNRAMIDGCIYLHPSHQIAQTEFRSSLSLESPSFYLEISRAEDGGCTMQIGDTDLNIHPPCKNSIRLLSLVPYIEERMAQGEEGFLSIEDAYIRWRELGGIGEPPRIAQDHADVRKILNQLGVVDAEKLFERSSENSKKARISIDPKQMKVEGFD
jgi:hypothetical protein